MGKFRRAIASIAMVAILSTLVVSVGAFAATYEDVPVDHWSYSYVEQLVADGVLDTSHDNFRPSDPVNRAEFGKMIVEKFGFEGGGLCSTDFADCTAGAWYDTYLGVAVAHNLLRGDSDTGLMRPGDNINRAEAITVIHRAAGEVQTAFKGSRVYSDVGAGSWYDVSTGWAYCYGVAEGYADGHFGAANELLRSEAAKIIVEGEDPGDLRAVCKDVEDPEDPEVPAGDLTVSYASNNPSSGYILFDTEGVDGSAEYHTLVGAYDFRSTEGSARVDTVEFTRGGFVTDAQIADAYLYVDGELVADSYTSSKAREFRFHNATGLFTVASGATANVELRIELDAAEDLASGTTVRFDLTGVSASGSVTGLPLTGTTFATQEVAVLASLNLVFDNEATAVNVGDTGEELLEIEFDVGEEIRVEELSLSFIGSLSSTDVRNLKLLDDEENVVGEAATLSSAKVAKFEGLDLLLDGRETFTLVGDIRGGSGRDFRVVLDESQHIKAFDVEYEVRIKVERSESEVIDIEPGDFEVERAVDSPLGGVVLGGKDVVLARYDFTARGENVRVLALNGTFASTIDGGDPGFIRNFRVEVDGGTKGATKSTHDVETGNGAFEFTFGSSFNIPEGETAVVELIADLDDDSLTAGDLLRVIGGDVDIRLMDANLVLDGGEYGLPDGNLLVLVESELDVVRSSNTPDSAILAMGQTYEVGRWDITPENEGTQLRKVKFEETNTELEKNVNSATLKLYKGGELVKTRTRTLPSDIDEVILFGNRNDELGWTGQTRLDWDLEKDEVYQLALELNFTVWGAAESGAESGSPIRAKLAEMNHYPAETKDPDAIWDTGSTANRHVLYRSAFTVEGSSDQSYTFTEGIERKVLEFTAKAQAHRAVMYGVKLETSGDAKATMNGTQPLRIKDGTTVVAELRNVNPGVDYTVDSGVVTSAAHGREVGDVFAFVVGGGSETLVVVKVIDDDNFVVKQLNGEDATDEADSAASAANVTFLAEDTLYVPFLEPNSTGRIAAGSQVTYVVYGDTMGANFDPDSTERLTVEITGGESIYWWDEYLTFNWETMELIQEALVLDGSILGTTRY